MSKSEKAPNSDIESQLKNSLELEDVEISESRDSDPLISSKKMEDFFTQTSKTLFEICSDERWKVADGITNAFFGAAFVGMSEMKEVAESEGMMGIHAALGGILSTKIIRTLAEAGTSIYYRNDNLTESAVEINLFKKLSELQGRSPSYEPIIEAINEALKKSDAPPISEEIIRFLKEDPQETNFIGLTRKNSEISNYKILALSAVLGIACTAAGGASMALTENSIPAAITTAVGLASSSIASATLNAATASPKNISENTYKALFLVNEKFFTSLKEDVESAIEGLPESLDKLRAEVRKKTSSPLKLSSTSRVAIEVVNPSLNSEYYNIA